MSDFYDQDKDHDFSNPNFRYLKYALAIIVASAVWGFTTGFFDQWTSKSSGALVSDAAYREQALVWEPCDSEIFVPSEYQNSEFDQEAATCGTFKVPAIYTSGYGADPADLNISMIKSPALDQENKIGTLFFNPGGPGESGIDIVQTLVVPSEVRAKYDLVGFDPRGVGRSSPIRCDDTASLDYYFETVSSPENEAEGLANEKWMRASVDACAKANPNWWVMTTLNTVRDMDIMREVVTGDEKFNFVGFSYGTTLAVEYIRTFPEHAGRIVLDSVTSNDDTDYNQAQLESTYKALTALFDKCAPDPKCPGETNTQVQDIIFDAQQKADAGTITGWAANLSSLDEGGEFVTTDDEFIYDGLMALSYGATEDSYPAFADAMVALTEGEVWNLEYEALWMIGWEYDGEGWVRNNSSDLLNIVNCLDTDSRDTRSREEILEDEKRFADADPFTSEFFAAKSGYVFAGKRAGCQWSWLAFDDPKIPDPPSVMETPVNKSGQRFLVIGSNLDTVTPIENAKSTAELLESELLIYEGSGHAPSFGGIKCIDEAVAKYLVEGYLPSRTISCPGE